MSEKGLGRSETVKEDLLFQAFYPMYFVGLLNVWSAIILFFVGWYGVIEEYGNRFWPGSLFMIFCLFLMILFAVYIFEKKNQMLEKRFGFFIEDKELREFVRQTNFCIQRSGSDFLKRKKGSEKKCRFYFRESFIAGNLLAVLFLVTNFEAILMSVVLLSIVWGVKFAKKEEYQELFLDKFHFHLYFFFGVILMASMCFCAILLYGVARASYPIGIVLVIDLMLFGYLWFAERPRTSQPG